MDVVRKNEFPSPYSGILFLFHVGGVACNFLPFGFPSPHSGILFLFQTINCTQGKGTRRVSVPSFGDSFFMSLSLPLLMVRWLLFPSPHSGILFLFVAALALTLDAKVSVPSFGDSFFMKVDVRIDEITDNGFRPLIRGFFFYEFVITALDGAVVIVSVPSFGDSFFICSSVSIDA